jgi:hypothetical protein
MGLDLVRGRNHGRLTGSSGAERSRRICRGGAFRATHRALAFSSRLFRTAWAGFDFVRSPQQNRLQGLNAWK